MRALRLGVLVGDQLIEERVVPAGELVTIGQSLKATLSLPFDGVPQLAPLFDAPVAIGAKGKLTFGEVVVLYQEIAAPPVAPKVTLPASVRGTLADRFDRRLLVILGASLLAHAGIGIGAWLTDVDTGEAYAAAAPDHIFRPDTVAGITIDAANVPDTLPVKAPTEHVAAVIPKPSETPRPTHSAPRPVPNRPVERPVDPNAFIGAMTGEDPGRNGHDEMPDRRSNKQLDSQLKDAQGRNVTVGDSDRGTHGGNPAHVGTGRDPVVDGPNGPTQIDKGGEDPMRPLPPTPPAQKQLVSTLTADMVMSRINASYQPGLRRCYEKGMRSDSTLAGKIRVNLVVGPDGGVTTASAQGVSDEVDSCVQNLMQSWSFDVPKNAKGVPTSASFRLSLALASG